MQNYTEFQSANHDLKLALACDQTDDAICNDLLTRRNEAAEAIYDDQFVDIRIKLQVAQIDCADRDHGATLGVIERLAERSESIRLMDSKLFEVSLPADFDPVAHRAEQDRISDILNGYFDDEVDADAMHGDGRATA